MIRKRIIPCLDCDFQNHKTQVLKGKKFKQMKYAGDPVELAKKYYKEGADEIVILDITASKGERATMMNVVERVAENVLIPICVGGGIKRVDDFVDLLKVGVDKCSINTAAIVNPEFINEVSEIVGSLSCVVGIDAKRRYLENPKESDDKNIVMTENRDYCWFETSIHGGSEFTGEDAIDWAQECQERGAGEILLTSVDRDGTKDGYDLELTKAINDAVDIPVIASGGVGSPKDIFDAFEIADASAALAASIFHFDEYPVPVVKEYLKEKGINVRL